MIEGGFYIFFLLSMRVFSATKGMRLVLHSTRIVDSGVQYD